MLYGHFFNSKDTQEANYIWMESSSQVKKFFFFSTIYFTTRSNQRRQPYQKQIQPINEKENGSC